MNYSYLIAINNIEILQNQGFNIVGNDGEYEVTFQDDKIDEYEKFVIENLKEGFWNEYLGEKIVFIFKFKDGQVQKYALSDENEGEILELCNQFANANFESIETMLKDTPFYANTFYKK